MTRTKVDVSAMCAFAAALFLLGIPSVQAAVVSVNFDDGTTGALNAPVNVSSRNLTTTVTLDTHGLPGADKKLFISYGYGSPGQDKAVIDTNQSFTNVVVSAVVGTYGTGYAGGGGGVVAGMPAAGGAGYLLYLTNQWSGGGGAYWDSSLGSSDQNWQLILVRKAAGTATPLAAGSVYTSAQLLGVVADTPNFLRLTLNGNLVSGEVWLGQSSPVGAATTTIGVSDSSPLSGYAGVYLAGRNQKSPYAATWGQTAIDDFTADMVPEPATLALLALGGLLIRRRGR
jgi:hypothetical protein